jgi:hypothetical protein
VPTSKDFGGNRFSTNGASGRTGYWNPGAASLANQAAIVTGNFGEVTLEWAAP